MANKEDIFVIFMVLTVAVVLVSDVNLTGNVVTFQETSASVQLCQIATNEDSCLVVERRAFSGEVETLELPPTDWDQILIDFGVNCDNALQGKLSLDENDHLLYVDVIMGKGGGYCAFNDQKRYIPEGSRIVYTPEDITTFLSAQIKVPRIVSSEVFPSASQTSTRNTIKVCFSGADKYSLANAELKRADGIVSIIPLFDDGNHFDNLKGDGCYGTVLDGLLTNGQYSVSYVISA